MVTMTTTTTTSKVNGDDGDDLDSFAIGAWLAEVASQSDVDAEQETCARRHHTALYGPGVPFSWLRRGRVGAKGGRGW